MFVFVGMIQKKIFSEIFQHERKIKKSMKIKLPAKPMFFEIGN